jgi:hypothetical protein
VRAHLFGLAEQLIDVAFPIADMHAALRVTEQMRRLLKVSSQRMLSFSSIGTRVGLILRLSAFAPLNFLRDQNLIAANPSGKPSVVTARLECIKMPHAVYSLGRLSLLSAGNVDASLADRLNVCALIGKLGCVVQHQDWPVRCGHSITRRVEMPSQDIRFAHPLVIEERLIEGLR